MAQYESGSADTLYSNMAQLQGDSSWTTINTTYPTYYRKVFGIVTVVMRLNGGSTPTDGAVLGTLPNGYRPVYQMVASTQNLRGSLMVGTNGEITISQNSGQTLNNYMGAVITYPA